jgi:hypothetical protein
MYIHYICNISNDHHVWIITLFFFYYYYNDTVIKNNILRILQYIIKTFFFGEIIHKT